MIIGHMPAGYLISRWLLRHIDAAKIQPERFVAAGMLGAVAPDFDMLYFHLVDNRQHNHHTYFSHFPLTWLVLLILSAGWLHFGRSKSIAILAVIFSVNGMFHMVLDTVAGGIRWLAPFIDQNFLFFSPRAFYKPWWLNFILHWSFLLEMCLLTGAFWTWRRTDIKSRT